MKTLFVAFSHALTPSQTEGFKTQYGDYTVVTLKDVNPELQQAMSNIPATATLLEIQKLAKAIVAEAVKVGATHFFCTGEPTLTMWANLMASGQTYFTDCEKIGVGFEAISRMAIPDKSQMTCIQSTTERKTVETIKYSLIVFSEYVGEAESKGLFSFEDAVKEYNEYSKAYECDWVDTPKQNSEFKAECSWKTQWVNVQPVFEKTSVFQHVQWREMF